MEKYCEKRNINITKLVATPEIYFYELSRGTFTIIVNKRLEIISFPNCEDIIDTNLSTESGVDILECFIFYEALIDRLICNIGNIKLFYEHYDNVFRVVFATSYKDQISFKIDDIGRLHAAMDLFPCIFRPRRLSLTFVD